MEERSREQVTLPGIGIPQPHPGSWRGCSWEDAWWPGLSPWGLTRCSPKKRHGPALLQAHHPQEVVGVRCNMFWVVANSRGPEVLREVECNWLDIVGLSSMHGLGSETSLLKRGWIQFQYGVALCERWMGIRASPLACCLHFGVLLMNQGVVCSSGQRTGPDCCLCLCPNDSLGYPALCEAVGGCFMVLP